MELEFPVAAGGIVEGRCVADGTRPDRAERGGPRDGGIAAAVFPLEARVVELQRKIQAGGLQLCFREGDGAAPAAVGHAVIPFAGDASRRTAGYFPTSIERAAKRRGGFEEVVNVFKLSADAQRPLSSDEIIAEAKFELIDRSRDNAGFCGGLLELSGSFFLCRFDRDLNRKQ